jgi:phospholipid transport system substrate-binding protein
MSQMIASIGRRSVLHASISCLLLGYAMPVRAAEADTAVAPVQLLVDGLLRVMKAGSTTPFAQRFDMLAPVIDSTFDLVTILHESVGPTWDNLPDDQKTLLETAFRRYTVASYVNSFNAFNGQTFKVAPTPRSVANGEQVVRTQITPTSGDSHVLDYVMRDVSGTWRAVDVLADGAVSRVAVQRSDFRRLLARGGAAALAESLTSKVTDLSGGAG